jgi:hypothetical protein
MQVLVLRSSSVSEKLVVNKKGVIKNYIPGRNNNIGMG